MDPNFPHDTPDYYSPPPPSPTPPPPLPAAPPPPPPAAAAIAPQPSGAMNSPSPSPSPLHELLQLPSLDHTLHHLQAYIHSNNYTFCVPSYGNLSWSESDYGQEYLDLDLANIRDDFLAEEAMSWLFVDDPPPSHAASGIRNPSESHDDQYLASANYTGSSTQFDYHNHEENPGGVSQSTSIIDTMGSASSNVASNAGLSTSLQRSHGEQEALHDRQAICIRVRSVEQLILNDGYFWRKYGEKRIKNKEFTRSYFKCAESCCNVVKHVERCSENSEFVIMTYIGRHNHQCHA